MEDRYARHTQLSAFTSEQHQNIKNAVVICIGAGGVASSFLQYITGAGVKQLVICDFDLVEITNLHRQVIHREDSAEKKLNKAISAKQQLQALNSDVQIDTIDQKLTTENIDQILSQYKPTIIVDTTDNPETRFLVADYSRVKNIPHIYAAAVKFDCSISSFNIVPQTACFRCLFSALPPQKLRMTAKSDGVLGPVVSLIGSLAAIETLKIIAYRGNNKLLKERCLVEKLVLFDVLNGINGRTMRLKKKQNCKYCQERDAAK